MGIAFRSGGYERHVRLGGRTVKDGEAAAIWDRFGVHRQIIGPKRIWMFASTIRFLTRHKAESDQFLKVRHRDGRVEHINGPASLYENPALHDAVSVCDGIRLESNSDCILVYCEKETPAAELCSAVRSDSPAGVAGTSVSPQPVLPAKVSNNTIETPVEIVMGPTLYLPKEDEWLHQFAWSGTGGDDISLEPAKNKFFVLQTDNNRTWKLRVPVMTSDSVRFFASIAVNYHLVALDRCVVAKDPIKKMHAGLLADAQVFGNTLTSDQLRAGEQQSVTARLTRLEETYHFLCAAAEEVGFQIDSVRVMGLANSNEFQRQVEHEQQMAARLCAEVTDKRKRRELHALELEDRRKKIDQEAELKRKEFEVAAKLEEESHSLKQAAVERKLELQQKEAEAAQRKAEQQDAAVLRFLKSLKEEGVDMTQFMCTAAGMQIAAKTLAKAEALGSTKLGCFEQVPTQANQQNLRM